MALFSKVQHFWNKYLNPFNLIHPIADVYRSLFVIEIIFGLKPYLVIIRSKNWTPKLILNKIGYILTIFHLIVFIGSTISIYVMDFDEKPILLDSKIALLQLIFLKWCRILTTICAFILLYYQRNRDLLFIKLTQRINFHYKVLGIDIQIVRRQLTILARRCSFFIIVQLILILINGAYSSTSVIKGIWGIPFCIIRVMPSLYTQVIITQCMCSCIYMKRLWGVLNDLLTQIHLEEQRKIKIDFKM